MYNEQLYFRCLDSRLKIMMKLQEFSMRCLANDSRDLQVLLEVWLLLVVEMELGPIRDRHPRTVLVAFSMSSKAACKLHDLHNS